VGISPNPVRWCGTESGNPPGYPNIWSTATDNDGGVPPDTAGAVWNPSGVDFTLQNGDHWFITISDSIHPLTDLIDVYHRSVGANGKLELDFAVSRTGQLDPRHVRAYAAFGAWMRACYDAPLASASPGTALTAVLALPGGAPAAVDRVMLREDLRGGQNVNGYVVEFDDGSGAWAPFVAGGTVGNKRIHIREGGAVNATRLRLTLAPSAFPAPYVQVVTTFAAFAPGPCVPAPPAPGARVRFQRGAQCLISNATARFPCGGGADNACPVFLGDCSDATAEWDDSDGTLQNIAVAAASGSAAGINIDCNAQAPGAVAKLLGAGAGGSANQIAFASGQLVYARSAAGAPALCLDGGGGPYSAPCGSEQRSSNQVATQDCAAAATAGWQRVVVAE
jgi:hypothetical protein